MDKKLQYELLSLLFAIVFCVLIMFPIYLKTGPYYIFYLSNILAILAFITFTRYLFLLKFSPFARSRWGRGILMAVSAVLFVFLLLSLMAFLRYFDEEGTVGFFRGSQDMDDYKYSKYIKLQYIFFVVSALVTSFLMPIRMIMSYWRTTNTQDKV